MRIFVSGGCKNGKSTHAQRLCKALAEKSGEPLYYIATMDPHDEEDLARIARHLQERAGWGFQTLEQPRNLSAVLEKTAGRGVFLLDSLTALLSNEMFPADGVDLTAGERVQEEMSAFLKSTEHCVVVSDYLYGGVGPYAGLTEEYCAALAACDCMAAKLCDTVLEVACGTITCHKGVLPCVL